MRMCLAAWLMLGSCVGAQTVPDNLKVPAGENLLLHARGEGDQVYVCDGSKWALSRPDAKLFDDSGKQIGSHFAGPTWEYADGSQVRGKVLATATPDPDSVPWLLLEATGHQGDGLMEHVANIQRLSTKGGKPPVTGCDAQQKGQQARSHYTAVYLFYAAAR